MSRQAEAELLQRARTGDRVAFEELRAVLTAPLKQFVRRLIGPFSPIDEILQETFLALYLNLERVDSVQYLRPFLFRVVRNRCYDELRRQGRFQLVSLDGDPELVDDTIPVVVDQQALPEEMAHWTLLYAEVRQVMDRLPELQRQTLLLYFEADLSYEQIAIAMATNVGTVKSRLHYAKKNLLKLLRPELVQALNIKPEPSD